MFFVFSVELFLHRVVSARRFAPSLPTARVYMYRKLCVQSIIKKEYLQQTLFENMGSLLLKK